MNSLKLKEELNKTVNIPMRISDVIIVRSALAHVLNYSDLSVPARTLIKEIDEGLFDSYKNVDCAFLTIENIVIIKDR